MQIMTNMMPPDRWRPPDHQYQAWWPMVTLGLANSLQAGITISAGTGNGRHVTSEPDIVTPEHRCCNNVTRPAQRSATRHPPGGAAPIPRC